MNDLTYKNGLNNDISIEDIVKNIYNNVFKFQRIEEILQDIHISFNKNKDIVLLWNGLYDFESKTLNLFNFSDNFNFTFTNFNELIQKNFLDNILNDNSFFINNDIKQSITTSENEINYYSLNFKKILIEKNISSYIVITIPFSKKQCIIISMFSNKKDFFIESTLMILQNFQKFFSIFIKFSFDHILSYSFLDAIDNSEIWFMITDEEGTIEYVNTFIEKLSLYPKHTIIGNKPRIFKSSIQTPDFYKKLWYTIKEKGEIFSGIFINNSKDGKLFFLQQTIIPIKTYKNIRKFVSIGFEINKSKEFNSNLKDLEYFDPITKLPNETLILNYINDIIQNNKTNYLCIVIDIDDFTYLNSFFEKTIADEILIKFSQNILQTLKRYNACLGRIGADEFAIFIELPEEYNDKENKFLSILISNIKKQITILNNQFYLNFHTGVSRYPKDSKNSKELLEYAKIVQKNCKKSKIHSFEFFTKEIKKITNLYFLIQQKFDYFQLKDHGFFLVFQPYYHLQYNKISGFETLARWNDKNLGMISPIEFIPVLEESHLIKSFELSLIQSFLETYRYLIEQNSSISLKTFSINLSSISFMDPFFMDNIIQLIKKNQDILPKIVFEITERSYVDQFEYANNEIQELKNFGFLIAIDDFGTGYSSLQYVMNLDIDFIKIDKIFIKNFKDLKSFTILETIGMFTKKLNIKCIAEGIETQEQLKILKYLRIDYGQGFLLCEPLLVDELIKLNFSV